MHSRMPPQTLNTDICRDRAPDSDLRMGLAYYIKTEPKLVTLDVQPTLPRMTVTTTPILMTLMPASKVVVLSEARVLLGFEALRVQGFPEETLKQYIAAQSSKHIEMDPFFLDLAGNAFCGPIVCAVLMAILARAPAALVRRFAVAQDGGEAASSGEDTDVFADILAM